MAPPLSLTWTVLAGGGGIMQSESYIVMPTLGQPAIGTMTSASYILQTGYWAGAWPWQSRWLPFIEK